MRAEKVQIVQEIKGLIESKPFILISYKGLSAAVLSSFRTKLSAFGAECHIVPNKLLLCAAKELGLDSVAAVELSGDTAMVSGSCDPVALARAVRDFVKELKEKVTVKWGFIEGTLVSAEEVQALADLPSREVMLAQLLGLLEAPAGQLVRVLNAKVSSIVYVLNAFLSKKEQAA
ncbi:MAG: 50S ribosomal protein L10 [Lentisphaeria bacterium]|nr:50S ribosomal protein L10 [Lentisphaeria bacterium]